MHTEHQTRFLRGAVVRAAVLAGVYGVFLFLVDMRALDTLFFALVVFVAALAVGFLLHWRDIIETVRARRQS